MKKEFLAGSITAGIHTSALLLLFFSVAWHTQKTLPIEVQLWDVEPIPTIPTTQPTTPTVVAEAPPPTPEPTPPEDQPADIVLKKPPIKPPVPAPVPPPKVVVPSTPPAINHRAEELKRLLGQSQSAKPAPTTNATANDAENAYQKRIGSELRAKVFFDDALSHNTNPQISIRITLNASGQLIGVNTLKPSGIPVFDQAVLRGIERLNKFPADKDGTYPPEVILNYRMRP